MTKDSEGERIMYGKRKIIYGDQHTNMIKLSLMSSFFVITYNCTT